MDLSISGLIGPRDVDRRVPESQAQARQGLAFSLLFVAAAALVVATNGDRWTAVHLFVAGGMVSAFSGVSVLLAATWSAASAPPPLLGLLQRLAVVFGAAGIVVGREWGYGDSWMSSFGGLYGLGLLALAVLLVTTVRRGSKRRFDPAVAGWAVALLLALAGSTFGVLVATGRPELELRPMHLTTNLLAFLGVVIAVTVPFFGSTVVRAKMNRRATPRALYGALAILVGGSVLAVVGLANDSSTMTAVGLGVYAAGIVAIYAISPTPTARQLEWAGPRLLGLWIGGLWWTVAVVASAIEAAGHTSPFLGRWLVVLLVGGYAQILWASMVYLFPMLRGGGPKALSAGFDTTRSWPALVAFQVAVVAAIAEAGLVVRVAVALIVMDMAWRVARVGFGSALARADVHAV